MTGVQVSELPAETVAGWAKELGAEAFAVMPHHDLRRLVAGADLEAFRSRWDELRPDVALPDGGQYRLRRYGRLLAEVDHGAYRFSALSHTAFHQEADLIPEYGGWPRMFAPVEPEVLLGPVLTRLIAVDLSLAMSLTPATRWVIGVHLVRVLAKAGAPGRPTPEGRHRDGHDYVGMHLINRTHCTGGESLIYRTGRPTVRITLTESLDSLFVDDDALTHEVTATAADGHGGVRDTLLVDLNAE